MSQPELRLARPEDIPHIEKLLAAEWLPPLQIAEWLETFWVLDRDGAVVGAAGLEVYGPAGVIRSVVVAPSERGNGLGDLLSRTAIAEAHKRRVERLYLFTGDKAPFWTRFGFEQCTLDDWEPVARESWQWQAISEHEQMRSLVITMRTDVQAAMRKPKN
jgi:N-acetylglutamate synthase-like GNAT family acetyltransferase